MDQPNDSSGNGNNGTLNGRRHLFHRCAAASFELSIDLFEWFYRYVEATQQREPEHHRVSDHAGSLVRCGQPTP